MDTFVRENSSSRSLPSLIDKFNGKFMFIIHFCSFYMTACDKQLHVIFFAKTNAKNIKHMSAGLGLCYG